MNAAVGHPRVPDERIAAHTNGDARRPPDTEAARVWRASASDFATTQAAAQVFRGCASMFRAFGLSDAQLLRIAPLVTHLGAVVYRADAEIERQQRAGSDRIVDVWSDELLSLLGTVGIGGDRVRRTVAPLPELIDLETAFVRRREVSVERLVRMIELRPFDLELATAVVAEVVGTRTADALCVPLHELYVLRDVLDDVRSLEEDERAGTFNCFLAAERLVGGDGARELLDGIVRDVDGRIVEWIAAATDASVVALSVAMAEPADDAAALAAWNLAAADPSVTRSALVEHLERGAARGFGAVWESAEHRERMPA